MNKQSYTPAQLDAALLNPGPFPARNLAEMVLLFPDKFSLDKIQNRLTPAKLNQVRQLIAQLKSSVDEQQAWDALKIDIASVEQIQAFIDAYPSSSHLAEANLRKNQRIRNNAEIEFARLQEEQYPSIADLQGFINRYPQFPDLTSLIQARLDKMRQEQEEEAWNRCATKADYEAFKDWFPSSRHLPDIPDRITAWEKQEQQRKWNEGETAWQQLCTVVTAPDKPARAVLLSMIDDFQQKYETHSAQAKMLKDQLTIEPIIQELERDPNAEAEKYISLFERFPQAEDHIRYLALTDMAAHPSKYKRSHVLKMTNPASFGGRTFLSLSNLLDHDLLTRAQYQYIQAHTSTVEDADEAEGNYPKEKFFGRADNTTDIVFFGVPGSGKTTVLAGLLSYFNRSSDEIQMEMLRGGKHTGINYALALRNYISKQVFPPRTQIDYKVIQPSGSLPPATQSGGNALLGGTSQTSGLPAPNKDKWKSSNDAFIQIIDAKLTENVYGKNRKKRQSYEHFVNLIDMPGERTIRLAGADVKDLDEALGSGTTALFTNGNKKVIFFIVDPHENSQQLVEMNGQQLWVSPAGALELVAQLLNEREDLMKDVVAIHIILSKSDLFVSDSDESEIRKKLDVNGYGTFLGAVRNLCKDSIGSVNSHCGGIPYIFTFSLGKVRPGEMVEYNPLDSGKILRVISQNTYSVREKNWFDTLTVNMNRSLAEIIAEIIAEKRMNKR